MEKPTASGSELLQQATQTTNQYLSESDQALKIRELEARIVQLEQMVAYLEDRLRNPNDY